MTKKLSKLPINDCIINNFFIDANEPKFEQLKYCEQNCGFRCLNGKEYKKQTIPTDSQGKEKLK